MQLIINIILSASIILLVAQSFSLIYYPVKFFHIAHAIVITLGAYFTYLFEIQLHLNTIISICFAILFCATVGMLLNVAVYQKLSKNGASSLVLLIASLGMLVVLQNIVSLVWGDDTKVIREHVVKTGNDFNGVFITNIQILTIVISILLFLSIIAILKFTHFGKNLRAISSNGNLATVFGVRKNSSITIAFATGSALAGIAGVLIAFENDMTPTMGFNILLYGVVAMVIGGVESVWGLIGGSLLIAVAQNLGAYYIDSKWMDAIAYIILILFLIWKPLGFSGKQLKKVKI